MRSNLPFVKGAHSAEQPELLCYERGRGKFMKSRALHRLPRVGNPKHPRALLPGFHGDEPLNQRTFLMNLDGRHLNKVQRLEDVLFLLHTGSSVLSWNSLE